MKLMKNDGFTLVELLITIVVGSVVALAATTILLLGFRLNSSSSKTAESQNTTRIFMAVVEKMASNGDIRKVVSGEEGWAVEGVDDDETDDIGNILFYYDEETKAIYTGDTPLMEDVISSSIYLDENVLTVGVETADGVYTSSVYCRIIPVPDTADAYVEGVIDDLESDTELTYKDARIAFLKKLLSQRGSTGMIIKELADGRRIKTPVYYSRWYNPDWPIDTPWCSCYISWALNEVREYVTASPYPTDDTGNKYLWFANVDFFMDFLKGENADYNEEKGTAMGHEWKDFDEEGYEPMPGDLIFFDWSGKQENPEHVGVVLAVEEDSIYTIEGNMGNMCVVRQYARTDTQIMGYGVIDWKPDEVDSEV